MKWIVTLEAAPADADRLLAEDINGLSAVEGEPDRIAYAIQHPEGASEAGEAEVVQDEVRALVAGLNGAGRVRWGKIFEGVELHHSETVDDAGEVTQRYYVDAAVGRLPPRAFGDLVERMGFPRPELPVGLEYIENLDLGAAVAAATSSPVASGVLQLVGLMLRDDDIDWGAAYTALEIIDYELRLHGVTGTELEWWTKKEREDFKATANAPLVLGIRARHGGSSGIAEGRMSSIEASYLVRRVVARWIASPYVRQPPNTGDDRD